MSRAEAEPRESRTVDEGKRWMPNKNWMLGKSVGKNGSRIRTGEETTAEASRRRDGEGQHLIEMDIPYREGAEMQRREG
eukprot:51178-Pleurochrysis_carterae.AAC.2